MSCYATQAKLDRAVAVIAGSELMTAQTNKNIKAKVTFSPLLAGFLCERAKNSKKYIS